jgi:hypothetical protein
VFDFISGNLRHVEEGNDLSHCMLFRENKRAYSVTIKIKIE